MSPMPQKYDYYQIALSRDLQDRLDKLFKDFPDVQKEYRKGNNPGYVRFIEEAVRSYITRKEGFELEKLRALKERNET